jgi:hypothetical protein
MKTILLCSDLDGTLIPNGAEPESRQARPVFHQLATRPDLRLAYVTGRDKNLVRQAIGDYGLPVPEFVIGDVGTTLYHVGGTRWQLNEAWQREIGRDWHGWRHDDITELLADMQGTDLELQPPEKQNQNKISYYTDPGADGQALGNRISARLGEHDIPANLIWSRDDARHRGLLDILPRRANKVRAIRFLMAAEKIAADLTVFAGDSGNDLDALTSGLQAILVKNAAADVRQSAIEKVSKDGGQDRLYLARGDFYGLNGNYAAGVLEGLVHFFPETIDLLKSAMDLSPPFFNRTVQTPQA